VLILLSIGIGLGLALREEPDSNAQAKPDSTSTRLGAATTRLAARPAAAADAGTADTTLSFPPETVLQSDAGSVVSSKKPTPKAKVEPERPRTKTKRRVRKPRVKRRRTARRHKTKRSKPSEITRTMVERKLRQVRREYSKFRGSYGHLLEDDWQKILFANTYGTADEKSNRRLNGMLDGLRGKMKRVRERAE
jgi:hypothetical protein